MTEIVATAAARLSSASINVIRAGVVAAGDLKKRFREYANIYDEHGDPHFEVRPFFERDGRFDDKYTTELIESVVAALMECASCTVNSGSTLILDHPWDIPSLLNQRTVYIRAFAAGANSEFYGVADMQNNARLTLEEFRRDELRASIKLMKIWQHCWNDQLQRASELAGSTHEFYISRISRTEEEGCAYDGTPIESAIAVNMAVFMNALQNLFVLVEHAAIKTQRETNPDHYADKANVGIF